MDHEAEVTSESPEQNCRAETIRASHKGYRHYQQNQNGVVVHDDVVV